MVFASYTVADAKSKQERLPAVGYCIYCYCIGSDANLLTDEHVIPDGIGGNLVLPKASCQNCARTFLAFENEFQKSWFGLARSTLDISSKKKRRKGYVSTNKISVEDRSYSNSELQRIAKSGRIPASSYEASEFVNFAAAFPIFSNGRPGILGSRSSERDSKISLGIVHDFKAPAEFTVMQTLKADDFIRSICKIAHAFAAAHLRLKLKPTLVDYIRNGGYPPFKYIGYRSDLIWHKGLHRIALRTMPCASSTAIGVDWKNFFVVHLQLFGEHGLPVYEVVVGESV